MPLVTCHGNGLNPSFTHNNVGAIFFLSIKSWHVQLRASWVSNSRDIRRVRAGWRPTMTMIPNRRRRPTATTGWCHDSPRPSVCSRYYDFSAGIDQTRTTDNRLPVGSLINRFRFFFFLLSVPTSLPRTNAIPLADHRSVGCVLFSSYRDPSTPIGRRTLY